jgi:hypothetical protein
MRYEQLWVEVEASDLATDVKKTVKRKLSDPTYSEAYVKLMVQWIKVALYTGKDRDLRLLIFGHAPRGRKEKPKDVD